MWKHYTNWTAVLAAARKQFEQRGFLYYQAPMDYRPHAVRVVRVYKNKKIRLDPEVAGTDPFTADRHHLDRFVWLD